MNGMKYMQDYNFKNKKALIRVDFNVSLDDDLNIIDSFRIDKAIPTIKKVLMDRGSVILVSHLGRPKSNYTDKLSLRHLVPYLTNKLGQTVSFSTNCIGKEVATYAKKLAPGEVLLLENVRFYAAEEAGDALFAQELASLGDVYIHDAFGTLHRKHASTYTIMKYLPDNLVGYLLQEEINSANRLLTDINRPFTAIIGGTKIIDKLPTINALLDKINNLIIGGGVANTFLKALGGNLGNSIVESDQIQLALDILHKATEKNVEIILPTDVIIAEKWDNNSKTYIVPSNKVPSNYMALDIGPDTQSIFSTIIQDSKTILWAGPIGAFELSNFSEGTKMTLEAVAKATQQGAFSLIGGGDSAAAVAQFGYTNKMSYISTGGSALLVYLADQNLPVIETLNS